MVLGRSAASDLRHQVGNEQSQCVGREIRFWRNVTENSNGAFKTRNEDAKGRYMAWQRAALTVLTSALLLVRKKVKPTFFIYTLGSLSLSPDLDLTSDNQYEIPISQNSHYHRYPS